MLFETLSFTDAPIIIEANSTIIEASSACELHARGFKSFPVEEDDHLYAVARYVERKALRANLARRAEDLPWGSLYRWLDGVADDKPVLAPWPVPRQASALSDLKVRVGRRR
jgi:hypothetical protein